MFDLLFAAGEFQLDCLQLNCSRFLQGKITQQNFVAHAKESARFGLKAYILLVQEFFGQNTSALLKEAGGLYRCPQEVLRILCESEDIKCSELDLFLFCIEWAKHECQKKKIEKSPENLRLTLGDILEKIRFSTIDLQDFQTVVLPLNILTHEEVRQVRVTSSRSNICIRNAAQANVSSTKIQGGSGEIHTFCKVNS